MYHGESGTDILNRVLARWPTPMGEIKSDSALYILLELITEEMSALSYNMAINNDHVHTVAGHVTSKAIDIPEVMDDPEPPLVKEDPLPLSPTEFMPELKKV